MIGTPSYVNAEITKLYLTKFTPAILPIYSANNQISSYSGIVDPWYEIKLVTATMTYSQDMSTNTQNGIYYIEKISINIPKAENSKWKELVNILTDKYILVFNDANDNCFTSGYRFGTRALSYQLSENQYVISFDSQHASNLPTLIDCQWVIDNIVNTPTPTPTPSMSATPLPSLSASPIPSATPSVTPSASISATPSITPSISITPSVTPSISMTPTPSSSPPPLESFFYQSFWTNPDPVHEPDINSWVDYTDNIPGVHRFYTGGAENGCLELLAYTIVDQNGVGTCTP